MRVLKRISMLSLLGVWACSPGGAASDATERTTAKDDAGKEDGDAENEQPSDDGSDAEILIPTGLFNSAYLTQIGTKVKSAFSPADCGKLLGDQPNMDDPLAMEKAIVEAPELAVHAVSCAVDAILTNGTSLFGKGGPFGDKEVKIAPGKSRVLKVAKEDKSGLDTKVEYVEAKVHPEGAEYRYEFRFYEPSDGDAMIATTVVWLEPLDEAQTKARTRIERYLKAESGLPKDARVVLDFDGSKNEIKALLIKDPSADRAYKVANIQIAMSWTGDAVTATGSYVLKPKFGIGGLSQGQPRYFPGNVKSGDTGHFRVHGVGKHTVQEQAFVPVDEQPDLKTVFDAFGFDKYLAELSPEPTDRIDYVKNPVYMTLEDGARVPKGEDLPANAEDLLTALKKAELPSYGDLTAKAVKPPQNAEKNDLEGRVAP